MYVVIKIYGRVGSCRCGLYEILFQKRPLEHIKNPFAAKTNSNLIPYQHKGIKNEKFQERCSVFPKTFIKRM